MPEIIDAHQHFWDIEHNYLPWLCDPVPIPFRYGDYSGLRRNYLPEHYRADCAEHSVVGSVCIEAEWDPSDPYGEVLWLSELIRARNLNSVIVAQAWLDRPDIAEVLEHHAANPFVRGIRHKPRVSSGPGMLDNGDSGSLTDPKWGRGFSMLARHGLSFDLQVPWWHLPDAARLAAKHPDTLLIVNHTGLPSNRSKDGLAHWYSAMRNLSEVANVVVKISGLGIAGQPWKREDNAAIVLDTIELFGTERCMFASNFPVDNLVGSFHTIMSGFSEIVSQFSTAERVALFSGNARRLYRMDTDKGTAAAT